MSKARELADVIGTQGTTEQVLSGRRNLIINGDFQVSQRGDFTTASGTVNNGYWVDRWMTSMSVTSERQHKLDEVVNGVTTNVARVEVTSSATGYIQLGQRLEIIKPLLGREITMSAWVKSSKPTNLYCYVGGPNTQYGYSDKHPADGQWHKLTSTFTVPSNATYITLWVSTYDGGAISLTSGDYFEAAMVQLELGSVATPFEHRSYGEELALCQRYYEKSGDGASATNGTSCTNYNGTGLRSNLRFNVVKRATPSITLDGSSSAGYDRFGTAFLTGEADFGADGVTPHAFRIVATMPASRDSSSVYFNQLRWEADAEL